jgi:hypothetical protein
MIAETEGSIGGDVLLAVALAGVGAAALVADVDGAGAAAMVDTNAGTRSTL